MEIFGNVCYGEKRDRPAHWAAAVQPALDAFACTDGRVYARVYARAKGGYLTISLSSFVLARDPVGTFPCKYAQGRTIQRFLCPAGRRAFASSCNVFTSISRLCGIRRSERERE